jgi:hypothetical protein
MGVVIGGNDRKIPVQAFFVGRVFFAQGKVDVVVDRLDEFVEVNGLGFCDVRSAEFVISFTVQGAPFILDKFFVIEMNYFI